MGHSPIADYVADGHAVAGFRMMRISGCTCGAKFDVADTDDAWSAHVAYERSRASFASASEEAKFVADAIDAVTTMPFPTRVKADAAAVVYKRGGKTFRLVVHDMTDPKETDIMTATAAAAVAPVDDDTFVIAPSPGFLVIQPDREHPLGLDNYGHSRDAGPIFGTVVSQNSVDGDFVDVGAIVVVHQDAPKIRIYGRKTGTALGLLIVRRSDVAATITKETTKP